MKKKELTPQQIVEAEIKSRGENNDWKAAYFTISRLIKRPDWRLFRSNDTLFLINNFKDKDKTVEFYIYNGDKNNELTENLRDFFKSLKISGFNVALFKPVGQHTEHTIRVANKSAAPVGTKIKVEL